MKRLLSILLTLTMFLGAVNCFNIEVEAYNEIDCLRFFINERTDYETYYIDVNCHNITSDEVVIPSEYNTVPVTRIESFFGSCENNYSVHIPETINYIENMAFGDCTSITAFYVAEENEYYKSVDGVLYSKDGTVLIRYPQVKDGDSFTVPDGVKVIADYAFVNCTNLNNIYLSDSVKSVGRWAFENTPYYDDIENWTGGVLYNNRHLLAVKSSVTGKFTVEDGIKNIAKGAFSSNDNLMSVFLPESVVTIQEGAFSGCDNLMEVSFSNGLEFVGNSAFSGCDSLSSVEFPESLQFIGMNAFLECQGLASVSFSESPLVIAEQAFWRCNALTGIEIPESVISVGDAAFADCENLATITIADGVDEIGYHTFNNTAYYNNEDNWDNGALYIDNHLISVKEDYTGVFSVKEGVKTIASYAFGWCEAVESITIPESVIEINDFAFWCCENLTSINLPSALTVLKEQVFGHCKKLFSIKIPESVTVIEYGAFWNCNALAELIIPEKVEYIGESAFVSCSSLQEIHIPKNVEYIGQKAFSGGKKLQNIVVDENNLYYASVDGVLFDKNIETLIQYPGRCEGQYKWLETTYEIPDTVKNIGNYAFGYCYELDNIIIPDSVTEIGAFAFAVCRNVKELIIPDSVVKIGWRAFDNCINLKTVSLSKNITYLSYGMFENCDSLETVEIPSNVVAILPYVFYYCDSLKSIIIPYGVTQIDYRLFYDCPSLESVTIPRTVKSICQFAFYNCENFKYVFYGGTQDEWNEIEIMESGIQWLLNAKFHFGTDGHTLGDWVTEKKATVYSAGEKVRRCSECGDAIEIIEIPQLKCSKPSLKSIESTQYGVLIKWGTVKGADTYRVYRKTSKTDWEYIGSTSKTYYTDKTAESGTKYYYAVRARNEAGNSSLSSSLSKYYLEDPTLNTPSSSSKGIGLRWSKVAGAQGYMVYRKEAGGSYKRIATEKGISNLTFRDTSAEKGKKYTYKVKAYYSKTYSAYSNTKTITDKY